MSEVLDFPINQCPFCHRQSGAVFVEEKKQWVAGCLSPKCGYLPSADPTKATAIQAWNRKSQDFADRLYGATYKGQWS